MPLPLNAQIEALLFWKGEPITKRELARVFSVNMVAVNDALKDLSAKLSERGVALMETEKEVSLATAPDVSELIEAYRKDELGSDMGKAALEALAVIVYRGGATRREIEYIRGVNSSSILRTLLIRGLVSRSTNPDDERVYVYKPTTELQALLGVRTLEELPEWNNVRAEFEAFETKERKATELEEDLENEREKDMLAE
jgi:segregation and condensation protein B